MKNKKVLKPKTYYKNTKTYKYHKNTVLTKSSEHISHKIGDWICAGCGNHNFSFRAYCNRCKKHCKKESISYCRDCNEWFRQPPNINQQYTQQKSQQKQQVQNQYYTYPNQNVGAFKSQHVQMNPRISQLRPSNLQLSNRQFTQVINPVPYYPNPTMPTSNNHYFNQFLANTISPTIQRQTPKKLASPLNLNVSKSPIKIVQKSPPSLVNHIQYVKSHPFQQEGFQNTLFCMTPQKGKQYRFDSSPTQVSKHFTAYQSPDKLPSISPLMNHINHIFFSSEQQLSSVKKMTSSQRSKTKQPIAFNFQTTQEKQVNPQSQNKQNQLSSSKKKLTRSHTQQFKHLKPNQLRHSQTNTISRSPIQVRKLDLSKVIYSQNASPVPKKNNKIFKELGFDQN